MSYRKIETKVDEGDSEGLVCRGGLIIDAAGIGHEEAEVIRKMLASYGELLSWVEQLKARGAKVSLDLSVEMLYDEEGGIVRDVT